MVHTVLKFAKQFSSPGKSLENRDKVWKKMVKSFFESYNNCFISEIFFPVGQIVFNLTCMFAAH